MPTLLTHHACGAHKAPRLPKRWAFYNPGLCRGEVNALGLGGQGTHLGIPAVHRDHGNKMALAGRPRSTGLKPVFSPLFSSARAPNREAFRNACPSVTYYETKPFLFFLESPETSTSTGQGGGTVPSGWLAAWRQILEFVQGLVEAALHRGLVAAELQKSVALIGILHEACLSSVE